MRQFRSRGNSVNRKGSGNCETYTSTDKDSPDEDTGVNDKTMEPTQATSINVISESDNISENGHAKSVFDHVEKRPASTPIALFRFQDEDGEGDHVDNDAEVALSSKPYARFDDNDESDDGDAYASDSEDEAEEESCLKQLYPAAYQAEYERLRIFEKVAHIFMSSLGIKGSWRIGLTGFRMFTRYNNNNNKKVSIKILFQWGM